MQPGGRAVYVYLSPFDAETATHQPRYRSGSVLVFDRLPPTAAMSDQKQIILVTGTNRGIGFAIIQALGRNTKTRTSTLLLGCRDPEKGEKAVLELEALGILSEVIPVELDVSSDDSIRQAVRFVRE